MIKGHDKQSYWYKLDQIISDGQLIENENELKKLIGDTDLFWKGKYGNIKYGDLSIGVFIPHEVIDKEVNLICLSEPMDSSPFMYLAFGCGRKELDMVSAILTNRKKSVSGLIIWRPENIPDVKWVEYE